MPSPEATRRVVICDASPLIFLAKLDGLELIAQVILGRLVVLGCVVREVLSERAADKLIIIEAMKMLTTVSAQNDGTIKDILVKKGVQVNFDDLLVVME